MLDNRISVYRDEIYPKLRYELIAVIKCANLKFPAFLFYKKALRGRNYLVVEQVSLYYAKFALQARWT